MGNCLGSGGGGAGGVPEECMLSEATRVGKGSRLGARLADDFKLQGAVLGMGRMASVRTASEKETGALVAVKACSKKLLAARPARISRTLEIEALLRVSKGPSPCPYIVKLIATYEDKQHLYLVLELVSGGDLFHHIAGRDCFRESDIRGIARQLLEAVQHCHVRGVVHRDLKPENVMLDRATGSKPLPVPAPDAYADAAVKLVDFGSAAVLGPEKAQNGEDTMPKPPSGTRAERERAVLSDFMGTAFYVAPEVWAHAYAEEVDLWSVGVLLYVLFTGQPPPSGLNRSNVHTNATWQALQEGKLPNMPPQVSQLARGLMHGLLEPEPHKRLTAKAALRHPWFGAFTEEEEAHLEGSIRGIRAYDFVRKLQKVVLTMLVILLHESEVDVFIFKIQTQEGSSKPETLHEDKEAGISLASVGSFLEGSTSAFDRPGGLSLDSLVSTLEAIGRPKEASQLLQAAEVSVHGLTRQVYSDVALFEPDELVQLLSRHVSTMKRALQKSTLTAVRPGGRARMGMRRRQLGRRGFGGARR